MEDCKIPQSSLSYSLEVKLDKEKRDELGASPAMVGVGGLPLVG